MGLAQRDQRDANHLEPSGTQLSPCGIRSHEGWWSSGSTLHFLGRADQ